MTDIAVIGAGGWGKNLVRTFYELGRLAAVAEWDPATAAALSDTYPELPVYRDFRQVIHSDIAAVVVATPAAAHYDLAKAALAAGKDVLVEKPMTLSAVQGEELVRLADANGCILMVGHLLLYQPAVQWIKTYLDDGNLGELRSLHQYRLQLGKARPVENALWSLGVHDIAVLLHLTGRTPAEIAVSGQAILQPVIEDDVQLHMTFADGAQAHLHTSWLWPDRERKLVVRGTRGMLVYDETSQTVTLHRKGIDGRLNIRDAGAELLYQGSSEPLTLECRHFIDSVERRTKPLSDGRHGLEVVRILEQTDHLLKRTVAQ